MTRRYLVDADSFFAGVEHGVEQFVPRETALRCADAMNGIIRRFGLNGKRVLSLGCGEAFEEFWFYKASCKLTLNDLDQTGSFERYLQRLPAPRRAELDFVVGDAGAFVARHSGDELYDVMYVSSFHPDEIRREEIQKEYIRHRSSLMKSMFITWPTGANGYHETLMNAAGCLRPGGLAIFQHYRGGVNVATNRHYLRDVHRQFKHNGLSLLEVYCFKASPSHLLVIAIKADPPEARRLARSLADRPGIQEFHGRYPNDIRKDVVRVFSAKNRASDYARVWRWTLTHYGRWLRRRIKADTM
jgi:hypothetical protein